ncbi:MAG: hypothetical protein H7335_12855 [Massilia sp.]|nr:hypothetical protein [Massilia sp.]
MMANPIRDLAVLRAHIAVRAARMVARDGADYGSAKRRALRELVGDAHPPAQLLPDNVEIEQEVRRYQALFLAEHQPARLRFLRVIALEVMAQLTQFRPYLTGAVLNGPAGAHDDVCLHLFADSAKDVLLFLLDRDVQFALCATPSAKGARQGHDPLETVSFEWRKQMVHATVYEFNDLRGGAKTRADKRALRADMNAVRAMLADTEPEESSKP